MSKLLIKRGRIIDPSQKLDTVGDILIEKGRIKTVGENLFELETQIIDAKGLVVCPAFVDLHAHLRDPGETYKEDIESASRCAVAGGFTTVVCMPNTKPPVDSPHVAQYIIDKARRVGLCQVIPSGTLTKGREGKELSDFYALKQAGCLTLTDDGSPLMDARLMQRALELAGQLGLLVMNHCEDDSLAYGHINEGYVSSVLGVSSRPAEAEDILVARDLILSYKTGSPIHIQHISSALSVELIRYFKEKGARVSCEVNPYHLLFSERELLKSGANAKVNPPLRREEDRLALLEAIKDGTIDCIATDHAPHAGWEKGRIESAKAGMIGLQTALPLALELVRQGHISLMRMIDLMSCKPASILGLEGCATLKVGSKANITIFDPEKVWTLNESTNLSKSRNTPLWDRELRGKVVYTIFEGKVVYRDV